MGEQTECPILCEKYTKVNPARQCPYCKYTACQRCQKVHVLSQTEPNCMNCRRVWPDEVMKNMFNKTFVNTELRQHLIRMLAERERAYFPEAIRHVTRIDLQNQLRLVNGKVDRRIGRIADIIDYNVRKRIQHVDTSKVDVIIGELNDIADEMAGLSGRLQALSEPGDVDAMEVSVAMTDEEESTASSSRNVVRHCPRMAARACCPTGAAWPAVPAFVTCARKCARTRHTRAIRTSGRASK